MSVWGPKLGFMKKSRPQGRQVDFLVGGGTWKLQIRNHGGHSAAKRREGIISDLLLSQTQTQPQPLSLYPSFDAAAAGQKSASEPTSRNLGDQSGFRGAVPNLVNHVIGPTTTGPTEGHGRNNEEVLEWRWLNKGLLGRRLMTLCVHNLARNGFGGVGNRSMGIPIGHAHLLLQYATE